MSEGRDQAIEEAFGEAWTGALSGPRGVLILEGGLARRHGWQTIPSELALVALVRAAFSAGWEAGDRVGL